ncbi:MAG: PDZ domain-containing protein [Chloroflexi bacterium]|nr:PDZ domain-containing protein [Chloroflexota bacterium]
MPTPTAWRAGWLRVAARGVAVVTIAALVTGCSAASSAQSGNTRASTQDETAAPKPSQSGAATGTVRGAAPTAATNNGLIPTSELANVYQQIVQRYPGPVDPSQIVESAVAAVHEAGAQANALPLDLAPIDLLPAPVGDPARDWSAFARGYDLMVAKHPAWAAQSRPDRAIVRGMLAALQDDAAQLLDPTDLVVTGETRITGVGVIMSKPGPTDPPYVSEVFRNSPAAGAGLRLGDQIVAVDGNPTNNLSVSQVSAMVRGQEGTAVTLSIMRGAPPPTDVRIRRAPVDTPPIDVNVRQDGLAVMRIRSFTEGTPEFVQRLLVTGRNQGIRGWILDLRGNSTGTPETMALVALNFLENRPVAYAVDRNGQRIALQAPGRSAAGRVPFAVVVDRGTSSWAEVFTASVKEYRAGPVVGAKTAGTVGLVTQQLSDGSAFQMTVARMQTPNGTPIDKQGVVPDVEAVAQVADLQQGDDPPVRRAAELLAARPVQVMR